MLYINDESACKYPRWSWFTKEKNNQQLNSHNSSIILFGMCKFEEKKKIFTIDLLSNKRSLKKKVWLQRLINNEARLPNAIKCITYEWNFKRWSAYFLCSFYNSIYFMERPPACSDPDRFGPVQRKFDFFGTETCWNNIYVHSAFSTNDRCTVNIHWK